METRHENVHGVYVQAFPRSPSVSSRATSVLHRARSPTTTTTTTMTTTTTTTATATTATMDRNGGEGGEERKKDGERERGRERERSWQEGVDPLPRPFRFKLFTVVGIMRVAWLPAVVTPRRTPSAHAAERRDASPRLASPRLASPRAAGRDLSNRTRATIGGATCRFPPSLSILLSALPHREDLSRSLARSLCFSPCGQNFGNEKKESVGCNDVTIGLILILSERVYAIRGIDKSFSR